MKLQYVKNYYGGDEATMLLYGPIGWDETACEGIRGQWFANELYWLKEQGVKRVKVRINSFGGNVADGQSIFAAIAFCGIEVDTYIDGMAVSIAGIIALAGRKRYMADYAKWMGHDPELDGELSEKDIIALTAIKDSLVKMITKESGLTADFVNEMLARETWLEADEAKTLGLVDDTFSTPERPNLTGVSMAKNKLYSVYNKFLNPDKTMKKVINHFKLEADASEDIIVSKIEALEAAKTEAENNLLTVKNKLEVLETEKANAEAEVARVEAEKATAAEATATANAEALVNTAVEEGKIDEADETVLAEVKNKYVALAKVDFATVKNMFDAMPKKGKKAEDIMGGDGKVKNSWTAAGLMAKINAEKKK